MPLIAASPALASKDHASNFQHHSLVWPGFEGLLHREVNVDHGQWNGLVMYIAFPFVPTAQAAERGLPTSTWKNTAWTLVRLYTSAPETAKYYNANRIPLESNMPSRQDKMDQDKMDQPNPPSLDEDCPPWLLVSAGQSSCNLIFLHSFSCSTRFSSRNRLSRRYIGETFSHEKPLEGRRTVV